MALLNDAPQTDSEKKMKRKKKWRLTSRKTRKTHHGSNGHDKGRWSELPFEILDMIVKRIFFIDLINLRAVCKSWHYYSYDQFQPLKQIPWLLVFGDFPTKNCSCKLIDPVYKKTYSINDPKTKKKKLYDLEVQESKCGWVLMSSKSNQPSSTSFLMYNPFLTKNNIIELPVLRSKFLLATFTTISSTSPNNCVYLAINNSASGEVVYISTCRRRDHTWKTQTVKCFFPLSNVKSVVYSEGVFYFPSYIGSIGTFNVDRKKWVVEEPKDREIVTESKDAKYYKIHLIESDVDGEFLLVLTWRRSEGGYTYPDVFAYRLDRSGMIWEGLRGLGDLSFFLARNGKSFAMEFPNWENRALFFSCGEAIYFNAPEYGGHDNQCHPCTRLYKSPEGRSKKPCWIEPSL